MSKYGDLVFCCSCIRTPGKALREPPLWGKRSGPFAPVVLQKSWWVFYPSTTAGQRENPRPGRIYRPAYITQRRRIVYDFGLKLHARRQGSSLNHPASVVNVHLYVPTHPNTRVQMIAIDALAEPDFSLSRIGVIGQFHRRFSYPVHSMWTFSQVVPPC